MVNLSCGLFDRLGLGENSLKTRSCAMCEIGKGKKRGEGRKRIWNGIKSDEAEKRRKRNKKECVNEREKSKYDQPNTKIELHEQNARVSLNFVRCRSECLLKLFLFQFLIT